MHSATALSNVGIEMETNSSNNSVTLSVGQIYFQK